MSNVFESLCTYLSSFAEETKTPDSVAAGYRISGRPDIQPLPCIRVLLLHRLCTGGLDVYLVLVEGEKEVCDNIGLQLGIGAGLLVFLIGLVTIVIYKCCIVVSISNKY